MADCANGMTFFMNFLRLFSFDRVLEMSLLSGKLPPFSCITYYTIRNYVHVLILWFNVNKPYLVKLSQHSQNCALPWWVVLGNIDGTMTRLIGHNLLLKVKTNMNT